MRSAIRLGMEEVREEERAAQGERLRRACEVKATIYTVAFWASVGLVVLVTWRWFTSRA